MPRYALCLLAVLSCSAAWPEETPAAPALDTQFVAPLLEAAGQYTEWPKADAHFRVAPTACAAFAGRPRESASTDTKTHGKKLYFLYVKQADAYNKLATQQPVGQVLVKESWEPSPRMFPEKQSDLFIMFKLDSKTPGTDNGWVYGTLTPDGKTVTAAGRIASCMKCHEEAKQDRMFGLPADPKAAPKEPARK